MKESELIERGPDVLPSGATVWLIEPNPLCFTEEEIEDVLRKIDEDFPKN